MKEIPVDKILLVGAGSIGCRHLRIIRQSLPKSKIAILRHQPSQRVPKGADLNLYTLNEAMRFGAKIAVIANPAPFHLAIAGPLAQQGCHLLIEKPLATDLAKAKQFQKIVQKSGIVCQVGYNLRFLSSLAEFRRIIQKGGIGRPLSIRCEVGQYLPTWRPRKDYRQGVSARRELGGGVLLELSHELDYLCWIFGEPKIIFADLKKISDLKINVEDIADVKLEFRDSRSKKTIIANLVMDFIRHDKTRRCTVIGSKGTLQWDQIQKTLKIFLKKTKHWTTLRKKNFKIDESYKLQWLDFLACARNYKKPKVLLDDGKKVLQTINKIKNYK